MKFDRSVFFDIHRLAVRFPVEGVSQSSKLKSNTIAFSLSVNEALIETLSQIKNIIIFTPRGSIFPEICHEGNLIIECENPRFEYIRTTAVVFRREKSIQNDLTYIDRSANVAESAIVSPFCFIGPNCFIDEDCFLAPGVRLIESVHVGRGTRLGANTVIGGWGFGIERDNGKEREVIPFGGVPIKMPHYGGVIIGQSCDIGALNTIAAGAIEPTILEDYVMTDDHVHIAHNCTIREGVAITACAEISGSVEIGKETWIGPNSSIMQKISIGAACVVGIGSVVRKSIPSDTIVAGNPARTLNK